MNSARTKTRKYCIQNATKIYKTDAKQTLQQL